MSFFKSNAGDLSKFGHEADDAAFVHLWVDSADEDLEGFVFLDGVGGGGVRTARIGKIGWGWGENWGKMSLVEIHIDRSHFLHC